MRKYNPKVSIVIPAYNASNYLAEAIESALAQTYKNIENVVVNDGSKDDGATCEVALSYGDRIRYFEKENGGSSSALNVGIANMTGEWFSWLSHDDLYTPEKVEKQIEYLNSLDSDANEIGEYVLFSASDIIDSEGNTIRKSNEKADKEIAELLKSLKSNAPLIAEPTRYNFHGCSCLVHRAVFDKIGCFDEKLRLLNDLDLWFRIYSNRYKIRYIPISLVKGRIHAKQVSKSIGYSYHNPEQDMFWKRSLDWIIDNHPNEYDLYLLFGRNAFLKTRNTDGERAFEYAKSLCPEKKSKLDFLKLEYKLRAKAWSFAKKIYLRLKT